MSITVRALQPINPWTVIGIFREPIVIRVVDEISKATPQVRNVNMRLDMYDAKSVFLYALS
jgi:hypothetical protein